MRSWKPRLRSLAGSIGWGEGVVPPQGHAASNVGEPPPDEYFAAMIYLPNPESRSGWELHGVERKKDEPSKGPLGFGRGG